MILKMGEFYCTNIISQGSINYFAAYKLYIKVPTMKKSENYVVLYQCKTS